MTKIGFGKRLALAAILATLAAPLAKAEEAQKAGKPINAGDVLSGELSVLHLRSMKPGEAAYQITSEPRRLPPPAGLCNLETGPETFQLVTSSNASRMLTARQREGGIRFGGKNNQIIQLS